MHQLSPCLNDWSVRQVIIDEALAKLTMQRPLYNVDHRTIALLGIPIHTKRKYYFLNLNDRYLSFYK